jgi:Rad3-related DNA helicase/DNA polymerase III epsilon subunit-like protein
MFDPVTQRTYVAIDVETTGLDPETDRITEIGAVRFREDGRVLDEYESLVNPGREIPQFIEQLTGVTNAAVKAAPSLDEIAGVITKFVGESVLVGQNVGFDLAYLRRGGVSLPLRALDTAELSRLLIPGRQPRGLVDLAALMGVAAGEHHRALPDARTAAAIFTALKARAGELDPAVRLQLARLTSIRDLTLAETIAGGEWDDLPPTERALPTVRPAPAWPGLTKADPRVPVPAGKVAAAFAAAARMPGFEERPEQLEMAEYVRNGLAGGGHYLVEAGTGVGKSLAYLVPAALHALANGERVVISTNTINLQEQLLTKDIPALRRMLKAAGLIKDEGDLRASLLKGRSNYLCLRRWTASYAANLGDPDFSRLAAAMLLWLPETETGDRSELNFDHNDWLTWQRFSAQDTDCLQRPNSYVKAGNCFLQRARKAAESAHLVVVNHALLLADIASGGSALPAYEHLVIDEAHNLEDQATQQFGGTVSRRLLHEALEGIARPRRGDQREGGVVSLLKAFPPGAAQMAGVALEQAALEASDKVSPCFEAMAAFVPRGSEDERVLVDRSLRAQPGWEIPEQAWDALDRALGQVSARATAASQAVTEHATVEEPDAIAGEVATAARKVEELRLLMARLMGATDNGTVVWLGRERDGSASMNSAPLDVGPMLWEQLLSKKETVIATSATLSAAGDMAYASRRLGFQEPGTLQLGSPFDYERATLLAAFTDVPEPNDPDYIDAVANAVVELVRASEGRALALFTSHSALRRVAEKARKPLEEEGISVRAQGVDGAPRQLTEDLVARPRSVIFGTSSFWEGVDIKGDALSMLIIARLPFSVPSDPVYRARSEQYDRPFDQYSLPQAILRFRQGFGRLIRDREDRGVVAVLDRRIYEKKYGDQFVAALPRCTKYRSTTEGVAARAREWLAR